MFVWALRSKASEWRTVESFLALGKLPFVPLVEAVCEPFIPDEAGRINDPVEETLALGAHVAPLTDSGRVWVDLGHLLRIFSVRDVVELHRILRRHVGLAAHLVTPVVRTSSPGEIVEAAFAWAREEGSGMCIRVDGLTHLANKAQTVHLIATSARLAPSNIDLVLDAQDLPRAVSHNDQRQAFELAENARSFVALAGAFPRSITEMSPDDYEHFRDRDEWSTWREEIIRRGNSRRPSYGDYATQPANYTPSPGHPGSPSVRYTTADRYVILRGRGAKKPDYHQFIGHARYLRRQEYYRDLVTTTADDYIERIARQGNGTGNLTTWRVASLQRHIRVVATQVAQYERVLSQRAVPAT